MTTNQQFICQGVNYRSHVEGVRPERLADFPFNTIFTKAPSCITAADAPVACPPHVQLLDYEIELGLVLRRDLPAGTQVRPDDLSPWLAGITIVNDLSARDIQLPQGQFYKGKSYRGFGPVGPGLVLLTPRGVGALAGTAHAARRQRPDAPGRLLRRDDPLAGRHADRARRSCTTCTPATSSLPARPRAARRARRASSRCSSSGTL